MPSPLSPTELFQARAGHDRTLAEMNAYARVLGARIMLANACNALETAERLVGSANAELAAAESEEIEAMRAAVEGRTK